MIEPRGNTCPQGPNRLSVVEVVGYDVRVVFHTRICNEPVAQDQQRLDRSGRRLDARIVLRSVGLIHRIRLF